MGFSRLRKKSSHIYIIIIIFLYGGLQAPIIRQNYITEHISHTSSAAPVQSCQMKTYVHSQIVYLVVEKLLCPIAFWFFGLGFWEKNVVFGNFKSTRYRILEILCGFQILLMIRYRMICLKSDNNKYLGRYEIRQNVPAAGTFSSPVKG